MADTRCPICNTRVETTSTAWPFCSSRCRLIDLGNWLDDRYTIEDHEPELEYEHLVDED
jgi:uncharacterized protein